ncbi:uroporphyrinogen decarboxylase [Wolbachia endosymbiont of Cruorifilaria tuberocauda]|uniref:uroporphyrinogen decarboxylase n=1 Tax=Wolbachia endosymbiont of Cruorifilaria tuberocauda TaxID=1812111 RepID=UPI0015884CFB|nr:uroporphyrinogen decarboxylase [Wolbachia endosymbiont of Cruorifilaria tuberocauda]QKX01466.1 uroporphyrinogen decarboxylase [Wolbachia endosymbiont of Cruorifilaria tuberocauda]
MTNSKATIAKVIRERKKGCRTPIWLMRQAGRSLPEYQEIMKGVSNFMRVCYNTDLIAEITLQPITRFDMDAAIIFSDILVIADALGYNVSFIPGEGPVIKPIESSKELRGLHEVEGKILPILNAIKMVRNKLPEEKSLIGFAGGPWTVASYIIEGRSSKNFSKALICHSSLEEVIEQITEATIIYLIRQIESGADVIKLFDSNAGILPSWKPFKKYVIEPTRKIVLAIKSKFPGFPIIGFPKFAGRFYKDYCEQTSISAISIDYSVSIEWAKKNLKLPLQGNLNPSLLAYDKAGAIKEARRIMDYLKDLPFIFNLGHGVLPNTPIENIAALVNFVKNY